MKRSFRPSSSALLRAASGEKTLTGGNEARGADGVRAVRSGCVLKSSSGRLICLCGSACSFPRNEEWRDAAPGRGEGEIERWSD